MLQWIIQFVEYRSGNLIKMEVLVDGDPVDAFTIHCPQGSGLSPGTAVGNQIKELIPRQLFDVPIQASAGGRVISRANVKALRKDVLAKCYGGDISRKKQIAGKTKKRQETNEDGWKCRDPPGSIYGSFTAGG